MDDVVFTCHINGLCEDILLSGAGPAILLDEAAVPGGMCQRGGSEQQVHTPSKHLLKITSNQATHLLRLSEILLIVPATTQFKINQFDKYQLSYSIHNIIEWSLSTANL